MARLATARGKESNRAGRTKLEVCQDQKMKKNKKWGDLENAV
jgi:hypothetical protein